MDEIGKHFEEFGFTGDGLHEILDAFALNVRDRNTSFPIVKQAASKMAGFIGSTLWLVWLLIIGVIFLRDRISGI